MQHQRIQLRAPEPTDVDTLYLWENDLSLWHHGNTIAPLSRYDLEQFVLNSQYDIYHNRQLRLMISLLESGETIGAVDLFEFDPTHKRAGVGILIESHFREKGYASEALDLLIAYAFNQLHLKQVYCHIRCTHQKSLRLFQGRGFEVSASLKNWLLINNTWEDVYFLQLFQN